jgi:tryptophan halogenase
MNKEINTFCIVGGGSAGWMTASILLKAFPDKKIKLIESPDVPTVGVGESTLAKIKIFTSFLDIDEKKFLEYTDGSYKMSIKFTNFYDTNSGSFHYPFGLPDLEQTSYGINDWFIQKAINNKLENNSFIEYYFPAAQLFLKNKFDTNSSNEFDNYNFLRDVAYHFDAVKFAFWLKQEYCIPKRIEYINKNIKAVKISENGVESVYTDDGECHVADLYIDCTGWKSLLIGKNLKQEFISYEYLLPNDSAIAAQIPYLDKKNQIEPYTNCTAIENGWVWNIPLWSRLGAGYVYSSKFVDQDKALKEFQKYLISKNLILEKNIDSLSYKNINMKIGIHKKIWFKNTVAIGLSAGFIEPLESNGLFTVHEFLFNLLKCLQRKRVTSLDIDAFNYSCNKIFHDFATFVAMHYHLSIRNDTDYWKYHTSKDIPEISNHLEALLPIQAKMEGKDLAINSGMLYIATGMNYLPKDFYQYLYQTHYYNINKKTIANSWEILKNKKEKWNNASLKKLSLFDYLKNNIYNNNINRASVL